MRKLSPICASIYASMVEASRSAGLPRTFKTDLTRHDRMWLADNMGRPFVWLLYENGTHLMGAIGGQRWHRHVAALATSLHGDPAFAGQWFVCDGTVLRSVASADAAIDAVRALCEAGRGDDAPG